MDGLDVVTLRIIAAYVDGRTLGRLARVSRTYREAVSAPRLWRAVCEAQLGLPQGSREDFARDVQQRLQRRRIQQCKDYGTT